MIEIKCNGCVIGTVEEPWALDDPNKNNDNINCIKFDKITINANQIDQLFARGYVHKNAQRYPIESLPIKDENGNVWQLQNVWFEEIGTSYISDDSIIIENVDCEFESIIPSANRK